MSILNFITKVPIIGRLISSLGRLYINKKSATIHNRGRGKVIKDIIGNNNKIEIGEGTFCNSLKIKVRGGG